MIDVAPHPLLALRAFVTTFPAPLAELGPTPSLASLLAPGAAAPFATGEATQRAVRDLLRHGGYKPTGRAKPASEYLTRAVAEGALPSINAAVDACNAVSLHTGLPVSVVDLARARAPFRVEVAPPGARYVFNAAGQEIDLAGLVLLCDADGPCASPVKDSHRTKTHGATTRTLSVVWGTTQLGDLTDRATAWYRALLQALGATTDDA